MSIAIKYRMHKKMAKGGMCDEHGLSMCEMCHGGKAMADGGEIKGIHHPALDKSGFSEAGVHARKIKNPSNMWLSEEHRNIAKDAHEQVINEMKVMKNKDRKYLADGGVVDDDSFGHEAEPGDVSPSPSPEPSRRQALIHSLKNAFGDADSAEAAEGHAHGGDIIDHVMRKRMMSRGGQVANDVGTGAEADMEPNQFDDLVLRDGLEEHYTGANSGDEIGNAQEDADRRDIVAMIMKSRKKKDRLPVPA